MTTSYYAAQKKVPFSWKNNADLGKAGFPSLDRYLADVGKVVKRMRAHAKAAPILLLSVPPLGDRVAFGDDDDDAAEARHVDGVIREMNAGLARLAAETEGATYLPFYEACEARLDALPGPLAPRVPAFRSLLSLSSSARSMRLSISSSISSDSL